MTLVSVILPVFNSAGTIARALDSVCAQTHADFEVLVVDDGSTDQTGAIVRTYAQKDSRIRYEGLAKNHGVSHARNVAISLASGEWVALLDADDWFAPDRLDQMLSQAEACDADILIDNMKIVRRSTGQVAGQTVFGHAAQVEPLTPRALFERDTPFSVCALGYAHPVMRTSFLRENGLCYNEAYALGEDFVFLADMLLSGAKAFLFPYAGYFYVMARGPLFPVFEPAGKANRGYQQVLSASDGLFSRYRDKIAPEVRTALIRRQKLFGLLNLAREIKFFIRRRMWPSVASRVLCQPSVIPFIARMMILRYFSTDFIDV